MVDDEPLTKRQHANALADAAGKAMWVRGPGPLPCQLVSLGGATTAPLTRM